MSEDLKKQIEAQIERAPVVVFMKGTPNMPMCGFSATAVEALRRAGAHHVEGVDVLADAAVRQGIKEYTGWPTLPQVFIRGKFVGGSDVVVELYQRGELQKLLTGAETGTPTAEA